MLVRWDGLNQCSAVKDLVGKAQRSGQRAAAGVSSCQL